MPFRPLFMAAALLLSGTAFATDWAADSATSTLSFAGKAEGLSFTGQFKQFQPAIHFDPTDLANARFDVSITLNSADTDNADRDDTLKGEDFFAISRFPVATYRASQFRELGEGRFAADGTLSLRDVEKPATLEFSWQQTGNKATLDGKALLNRLDFNIGAGDWSDDSTISHEITITTHLQLSTD